MNSKQRANAEELCRRLNALPIGAVGEDDDGVYIENPLKLLGTNDVLLGRVEDEGDGWFFTPVDNKPPLWVCRACHYGHFNECEDERCQSMRLEANHG